MITCVKGNGGARTRLAIESYLAMERVSNDEISLDDYCRIVNDIYKRKMQLGCPHCGTAKRFGIGPCRRCYRLHAALRKVKAVMTPQDFILKKSAEFTMFARSLENSQMSKSERINALLTWKPENSQI